MGARAVGPGEMHHRATSCEASQPSSPCSPRASVESAAAARLAAADAVRACNAGWCSQPRWKQQAPWALAVVMASLLGLSVAFNVHCLFARASLREELERPYLFDSSFVSEPLRDLPAELLRTSLDRSPSDVPGWSTIIGRGRALGSSGSSSGVSSTTHNESSSGSQTATSSDRGSSGGHHGPHKHDALLFLFNALVLGIMVTHCASLPLFHGMQETVAIFLLGFIYSLVQEGLGVKDDIGVFGQSYQMWIDIDPQLILFCILPALLAGSAMSIDTVVAKAVAYQCIYLATVVVLFNSLITALFLKVYLDWSFLLSLIMGSVLSATDSGAIVALLKELGVSPTLTVQIKGESLLNNGTAMVLYTLAYTMIIGDTYDASDVLMFIIKTGLMALLLGMVIGYLFFAWIRSANNRLEHSSSIIQISLALCCAYWSFILAEGVLNISGVLATGAASLMLAMNMWPHIVSEHAVHDVWNTFEGLGNVIIFFLSGALAGKSLPSVLKIDPVSYLHLCVIYLVVISIRAALVFASVPILRYLGKRKFSIGDTAVLSWGGIRGAISLVLAVKIKINRAQDADGRFHISIEDAERVLFFVSGVSMLSLVINAMTCPLLVRTLGLVTTPKARKYLQRMMHEQLVDVAKTRGVKPAVLDKINGVLALLGLTINDQRGTSRVVFPISKPTLFDVQISLQVSEAIQTELIKELHERRDEFDAMDIRAVLKDFGALPPMPLRDYEDTLEDVVINGVADWERVDAVNVAYMALVNTQYWRFLASNDLVAGSKEAEILLSSVSIAQSISPSHTLIDYDVVLPHVQESVWSEAMDGWFAASDRSDAVHDFASASPDDWKPTRSALRRRATKLDLNDDEVHHRCHTLVQSVFFSIGIAVMIIFNGIYIAVEENYRDNDNTQHPVWITLEVLFVIIFTLEFAVKLSSYGWRYFYDAWNCYDFVLVLLGIVGLVVSIVVTDTWGGAVQSNDVSQEARIIRFSRVLKVMRLLRLFRLLNFYRRIRARFTEQELNFEVEDHMKKMNILTIFIKAHLNAQVEFYQYFVGSLEDPDLISSSEVALCMLQSQMHCYSAAVLACLHLRDLDKAMMREVIAARKSKIVAEELEGFVMRAYHKGVVSSREAEAILKPLHMHIKECLTADKDSMRGLSMHKRKNSIFHVLRTSLRSSFGLKSNDTCASDQVVPVDNYHSSSSQRKSSVDSSTIMKSSSSSSGNCWGGAAETLSKQINSAWEEGSEERRRKNAVLADEAVSTISNDPGLDLIRDSTGSAAVGALGSALGTGGDLTPVFVEDAIVCQSD